VNNSVYTGSDLQGFRCHVCGEVYQSMWGEICNKCRIVENDNASLRVEIRRLTEVIKGKE